MGHKTGTTESASSEFPYESYRGTASWKLVDQAINDLVENQDIVENTRRDYIVGYICKNLNRPKRNKASR